MASLNMFIAPATTISPTTTTNTATSITTTSTITTTRARSVKTFATASKGSGKSSEEKGFFEWLAGALDKDGLVETDPLLQKVEGKSGGTTTTGKKTTGGTTAAPPKKSGGETGGFGGLGGLGGLFAKK
ncbi:uncharacterized protein [Rutidosis leptorrhynchoides]|uniref:uncharacterized protein n=1 Tax=Rutidosis leptorrhynchoides TaxID=125765 RepID=UPI003A9A188F